MKPKWTSHFNIQSAAHTPTHTRTHSHVCCRAYALLCVYVYCIKAPPLGSLAKAKHESEISGTYFKCRLQTTSRTRWFITHSTTSTASEAGREKQRERERDNCASLQSYKALIHRQRQLQRKLSLPYVKCTSALPLSALLSGFLPLLRSVVVSFHSVSLSHTNTHTHSSAHWKSDSAILVRLFQVHCQGHLLFSCAADIDSMRQKGTCGTTRADLQQQRQGSVHCEYTQ